MEFQSNIPLYLQVIRDIEKQIITGQLQAGEKLPSTRELAAQYQINPNTAVRVYNEMEAAGVACTRRGIGTFVTDDTARLLQLKTRRADELIKALVGELKDIGFNQQEILEAIANVFTTQ